MLLLAATREFGDGVRRDTSGKLTYTVGVRAMADARIAAGGRKRDTFVLLD